MVEAGECSGSGVGSADEVWAKLIPFDSTYTDFEITSEEVVVCSEIKSSCSDKREWCKITRTSDPFSAIIQNTSSNAILVDKLAIPIKDAIVIKSGSEIVPGPSSEDYLSYKFELMPEPENCKKKLKISIDAEHAKCSICLNVWHDVVTVAPCFHNFCNGCFSEWLKRSRNKDSGVLCPQCRAVAQFVGRNHFLHRIVEDILKADSSLKRSDEELAILDSYSSIHSNLVVKSGKKLRQKRVRSTLDVDNVDVDFPCHQCANEVDGFRCNTNTIHIQCHACGGMMPSRLNSVIPQHCLGCDRAFCGAYWHSHGVQRSDTHAMCSPETLKSTTTGNVYIMTAFSVVIFLFDDSPISDRSISRIPMLTHENNQHEQDVTQRCIQQMGRTLEDVVSDWIAKFDNREIDRTRMPLNHAERITSATHICNECYEKLVAFLLYWFRITLPNSLLPPDDSRRKNCWYGYACRTQHHNEDHARKRNHVCRPSRGDPN